MAPSSPRDVVLAYFDALNRHSLDDAAALLSTELVEDITGIGVFRGPGEVRDFFDGLFKAVPDLELIVDATTAEEDRVAVQWRMRGTFTGGPLFNGVQATGGRLELRGCDVLTVADGKIVRNMAYQDGTELGRTLGMLPPQDSPAEKAMIAAFNGVTKLRRQLRG